ncbi:hypothetical protein D3C75_669320 [compost metagenome]
MAGEQFDHKGEERRLRAAQIIAAVAVGNMSPGVNFMGEVIDHILHFVPVAAFRKPQHRKVAVPIIDFTKTPTRNHIRLRQRQQRIPFARAICGARQHRPQAVDMFTQRLAFWRNIFFTFFWQHKIHIHKVAQIEARLVSLHPVIGEDHQRIVFRHRIGKGLLVREQLCRLDIGKQWAKQNIRRLRQGLYTLIGCCWQGKTHEGTTDSYLNRNK